MGSDEWTDSDIQAERFFAQFEHASPELIAKVQAEQDVSVHLARVTAESREFGYWGRKIAERDARRAARDLAAARVRQAQTDRLDALRITPAPSDGTPQPQPVALPAPRIVILTDAERGDTERWWRRLAEHRGTKTLARRIRTEVRSAEQDARFQARATKAWQQEQRAFERAQWQAITKRGRARRKVANRWVAISEDRALAIALAALDQHPPQGR